MQATVHAHVQLTTPTSHDELSVPFVAHLTPELAVFNLGELATAVVLTVISITKLFLDLNNPALAFSWSYIRRSCSVHDLFGAPGEVALNPEETSALTGVRPFDPTSVTELGSACAAIHC